MNKQDIFNYIIIGILVVLLTLSALNHFKKPEPTPITYIQDNAEIVLAVDSLLKAREVYKEYHTIIKEKLVEAKNEIITADDSLLIGLFWKHYYGSDTTDNRFNGSTSW